MTDTETTYEYVITDKEGFKTAIKVTGPNVRAEIEVGNLCIYRDSNLVAAVKSGEWIGFSRRVVPTPDAVVSAWELVHDSMKVKKAYASADRGNAVRIYVN